MALLVWAKALPAHLAAKGVKIGIFDLNEERGEEIAKELGGTFAKVDVSDAASVAAGFEKKCAPQMAKSVLL